LMERNSEKRGDRKRDGENNFILWWRTTSSSNA
jgi:hypothetical protein